MVTNEWFKDWANEYDDTIGKINRHHHLLKLVIKLSNVKKDQKVLDWLWYRTFIIKIS